MACAACGHAFQGATIHKGKPKTNGEKVKSFYYTCSGYRNKGLAVCRKTLVHRDSLEVAVLGIVEDQLRGYLAAGGRERLLASVRELTRSNGDDPKAEIRDTRRRIADLDARADTLLDSLTPTNKEFVDRKLASIKKQRRALEARIEELEYPSGRPQFANGVALADGVGSKGRRFRRVASRQGRDVVYALESRPLCAAFQPRGVRSWIRLEG